MSDLTGKRSDGELMRESRQGDHSAFAEWFGRRRAAMTNEIRARLSGPFQRRVDASDVVQELFIDADRRLKELNTSGVPMDIWIRILLKQRLVDLQRQHVGAQRRSVGREQGTATGVDASGNPLDRLIADQTSPSQNLRQIERTHLIEHLLNQMPQPDAEILRLRHMRNLSNSDAAAALGISVNAASNRYVRALRHFRDAIEQLSHSI